MLRLSLITTAGIIATSIFTIPSATAQSVEPIYPTPSSTNATIDSNSPIQIQLTNQPNIELSSIKFLLNGSDLIGGNLSVNTSSGTLLYKVTPTTFNIGTNTLQAQFVTKTGITSQFSWSFQLTGATATTTPVTTTTTPATTTGVIPLKPSVTQQSFIGNALVLEGKTRPGAVIKVTGQATRPGTSLFSLGSVRIGSSDQTRSLNTTTVTADSQGLFKVQVDVLGDTTGTNYTMELTATENNMSESVAVQAKR